MTGPDLSLLKAQIARLAEIIKTAGGDNVEPSGPLSSTTDSSVKPYSTESKLPIGGPVSMPKKTTTKHPDYAYGQRGKKEAGKTKPGVTSLPSEPTFLRNPWTEHGTPYTEDNI